MTGVRSPRQLADQVREALVRPYKKVKEPAFFALDELPEFEALAELVLRLEQAEEHARQLAEATAFYADFEESGHSDWSMATDTLEALFGCVPPPGTPIDYRALSSQAQTSGLTNHPPGGQEAGKEPPDWSKCTCGAGPFGIHSRWCSLAQEAGKEQT